MTRAKTQSTPSSERETVFPFADLAAWRESLCSNRSVERLDLKLLPMEILDFSLACIIDREARPGRHTNRNSRDRANQTKEVEVNGY